MIIFNPLYQALAYIGYTDPLHPPFTHFPIALVTASLFFGLLALLRRRPGFWVTARHCLVLAWLFVFPTVWFGFMDWQQYYQGAWLDIIIVKICLAAFLFVVLSLGMILIYKGRGESRGLLAVYGVGFVTVVLLGYFGGKMVYEGRGEAAASPQAQIGEKIFVQSCRACHLEGGNLIKPQMPLKGSAPLTSFETFVAYIRDPRLPDGSRGAMPDFPASRIPQQQARDLYQYLIETFGKPRA
jgi:uncharacterized membrane protein